MRAIITCKKWTIVHKKFVDFQWISCVLYRIYKSPAYAITPRFNKVFSSTHKRIKLSASSPTAVNDQPENGEAQSEQHSDSNFYQNSRPGSSGKQITSHKYGKIYRIETIIYLDQSPLPSPRTTKTEATNGDSAARTSVSVSNNLRFTSKSRSNENNFLNLLTSDRISILTWHSIFWNLIF